VAIVLIGPPAAGKTSVGRKLAKRLGVEFIDTDKVLVAEHGPIADIFREHGEAHFRTLERKAVETALQRDAVVSLGGGAVLDPATRSDLGNASVVLLTVSREAAESRIGGGKRPLVQGIESWQALVDARAELYASLATVTFDTSDRPISQIVADIADWVGENR
jgi:shikimate kinase